MSEFGSEPAEAHVPPIGVRRRTGSYTVERRRGRAAARTREMTTRRPLLGTRLSAIGIAVVLTAVFAVACSDGSDLGSSAPPPSSAGSVTLDVDQIPQPPDFVNDPALEAYLLRDTPEVPERFVEVQRDDRQPILSLGRVQAAARASYVSGVTREHLTVDVLQIQSDIEPMGFFTAFVEALVQGSNFHDSRRIGVVRGVGDSARHFAFTLEGDDAEVAALLRGEIVALLFYRRPAAFRQPLDLSSLLVMIDLLIQFDARAATAGS